MISNDSLTLFKAVSVALLSVLDNFEGVAIDFIPNEEKPKDSSKVIVYRDKHELKIIDGKAYDLPHGQKVNIS